MKKPFSMISPRAWMTAALGAALLAGCGGGGGGSDGAADMPGDMAGGASIPDGALASSAAYTQFTLMSAQSGSESAEPLSADKVAVPPASETDEPLPLG